MSEELTIDELTSRRINKGIRFQSRFSETVKLDEASSLKILGRKDDPSKRNRFFRSYTMTMQLVQFGEVMRTSVFNMDSNKKKLFQWREEAGKFKDFVTEEEKRMESLGYEAKEVGYLKKITLQGEEITLCVKRMTSKSKDRKQYTSVTFLPSTSVLYHLCYMTENLDVAKAAVCFETDSDLVLMKKGYLPDSKVLEEAVEMKERAEFEIFSVYDHISAYSQANYIPYSSNRPNQSTIPVSRLSKFGFHF